MDDVVVVEKLHGGEELTRELEHEPFLHRRSEHRAERVVAALEREVEQVPLLEGVVDVDDVRVSERKESLHLLHPLRVDLRVGAVRRPDHLHRVDLIERADALVHRSELSSADDRLHGVRPPRRDEHGPDLRELHRDHRDRRRRDPDGRHPALRRVDRQRREAPTGEGATPGGGCT